MIKEANTFGAHKRIEFSSVETGLDPQISRSEAQIIHYKYANF